MRLRHPLIASALTVLLAISTAAAQETEQEIIDRYLNKTVAKHTHKLGWASINLSVDRVNRHNEYNDFTIIESTKLTVGQFAWMDQGFSLGADFGTVFKKRLAWSIGGEYWLKLGQTLAEGDSYLQLSTMTSVNANPRSELQVYGASTGFQYFLFNPPQTAAKLTGLTSRVGVSVGFYVAHWDLWPEYENLNLATGQPVSSNTTYKGTAPGFSFNLGMDYPLGLWDLGLAMDMSYLHLNFTNVAWYNTDGDEIIASLDGTPDGRVDLSLSGVRGKIEVKRYFNW